MPGFISSPHLKGGGRGELLFGVKRAHQLHELQGNLEDCERHEDMLGICSPKGLADR